MQSSDTQLLLFSYFIKSSLFFVYRPKYLGWELFTPKIFIFSRT
jgi:hypothetical protein